MTISGFTTDEHRYLSNFWYATVMNILDNDGIVYPSVEHAYQAAKTLDLTKRAQMATRFNARQVKIEGRSLNIREDWEFVKFKYMLKFVQYKFSHDVVLGMKLVLTGDQELIELNYWHDNIYGICECPKCTVLRKQNNIVGNMLGRILMNVRFVLQVRSNEVTK
jgi:ribA/ribD-fused uncharacterized protein